MVSKCQTEISKSGKKRSQLNLCVSFGENLRESFDLVSDRFDLSGENQSDQSVSSASPTVKQFLNAIEDCSPECLLGSVSLGGVPYVVSLSDED